MVTTSQAGTLPEDQKPAGREELGKRLKSVIDYVRDCERRVNRGEVLDLGGLDQNVVGICEGIAKLPPVEGRKMQDDMAALIADLDRLAVAMKAQQASAQTGGR